MEAGHCTCNVGIIENAWQNFLIQNEIRKKVYWIDKTVRPNRVFCMRSAVAASTFLCFTSLLTPFYCHVSGNFYLTSNKDCKS